MKTALVVTMCLLASFAVSASDRIDWRDVGTTVEIVGRLGVPIGTVVKVEATLVANGYLRVEAVEGVPCEGKPIMSFTDHSDDYVESLDPHESNRMDEEFRKRTPSGAPVGTRFTLYAFEAAFTSRNPRGKIPDGTFGFSSELLDPGVDRDTLLRTRLNVAIPQNAQPGATDNPDDAQRLREDH